MKRLLAAAGVLATASIVACTWVAGYPDTSDESSLELCHDADDNDLDGHVDCADPGCAQECPGEGDIDAASLSPCFADERLGLSFQPQPGLFTDLECEAFSDAPLDCGPEEVVFPGTFACRSMFDVGCGEDGGGPAGLPADALHVELGASDGNGSAEAPFGTIRRALEVAEPGAVIALGPGDWTEPVVLDRSLTLVGACSPGSRLRGDGGLPAVRVTASDVVVRGVSVEAPGAAGIVVEEGASLTLRSVGVHGAAGEGVRVEGGSLSAEELLVEGVTGEGSAAIRVGVGGQAAIATALVRDAEADAIAVDGGVLELRGVALRRPGAVGVDVGEGGSATLAGAVVTGAGQSHVRSQCGGGTEACLRITDSIVRAQEGAGSGVEVRSGAAELTRTFIGDANEVGLVVEGARVTATDVVVQGTEGPGVGVRVSGRGILDATRLRLRANYNRGLLVQEPGSQARISDLAVLAEQGGASQGVGVAVRDASLFLMGFLVDQAGRCGVAIEGDASFSLNTGVIADTLNGVCVSDAEASIGELTSATTYARVGNDVLVE